MGPWANAFAAWRSERLFVDANALAASMSSDVTVDVDVVEQVYGFHQMFMLTLPKMQTFWRKPRDVRFSTQVLP